MKVLISDDKDDMKWQDSYERKGFSGTWKLINYSSFVRILDRYDTQQHNTNANPTTF